MGSAAGPTPRSRLPAVVGAGGPRSPRPGAGAAVHALCTAALRWGERGLAYSEGLRRRLPPQQLCQGRLVVASSAGVRTETRWSGRGALVGAPQQGWELPVPLPAPTALLPGGRCRLQRPWSSSSLSPTGSNSEPGGGGCGSAAGRPAPASALQQKTFSIPRSGQQAQRRRVGAPRGVVKVGAAPRSIRAQLAGGSALAAGRSAAGALLLQIDLRSAIFQFQ